MSIWIEDSPWLMLFILKVPQQFFLCPSDSIESLTVGIVDPEDFAPKMMPENVEEAILFIVKISMG